jgi:fermentation-respiration switch protein FrsA (DUF1100 family)
MADDQRSNMKPPAPQHHLARRVRRRRAMALLSAVLGVLTAAYVAAGSYMYVFQRDFVFKPTGALAAPAEKGLEGISESVVALSDGTEVTIWHHPPTLPDAPTVLYFHGNSGNISSRAPRYRQILDSGFGLYAPSYRGYAGSEGTASEAAFVADGLEHFDRLAAEGGEIVLHGESLGTGVATAVAEARPGARLLVLEAPYTAALDIAAESYPWLPVSLLMKDPFLTRERIQNITVPLLVVHGTRDRIIPVEHGRKVFELAGSPKRLEIFEGAGHGDLWKRGLWPRVLDFLSATAG